MKEEQVILVNEKDEPIGLMNKWKHMKKQFCIEPFRFLF
jgi:isopentenyldiphosphate isomerase